MVFLYLKKVQFHVREDSLRALQAVLVDCPGLHASSWDKAVTRDCLKHAEAVIFLLGTEGRGLSETNLTDASDFAKNELGATCSLGSTSEAQPIRKAVNGCPTLSCECGRLV